MSVLILFIIQSTLIGVGLAADAFSVSVVIGLNNPGLQPIKAAKVAFIFAFFQAIMPLLGWILTNYLIQYFNKLQGFIPGLSFILLCFIGLKLLYESRKNKDNHTTAIGLSNTSLIIQGFATSLDALTIGFVIAEYSLKETLACAAIIALVTFTICHIGTIIGKKIGYKLQGQAEVFGGIVLIAIGIEILIKSLH